MKSLKILFVTIFVLSLAGSALATDSKTYTGATCDFQYSGSTPSKGYLWFKNESGDDQWVICPIVRDIVAGDVTHIDLYMDGYSSDGYTPRFYARSVEGGTLTSWLANGTNNFTGGKKYYWSTTMSPAGDAAYALSLKIPDDRAIFSYVVDEE